jgi:hypothetical protein
MTKKGPEKQAIIAILAGPFQLMVIWGDKSPTECP